MTKRILLIDDSPIIRAAYSVMLVDAGYEVATRAGVEGMDANRTDGFDLIC